MKLINNRNLYKAAFFICFILISIFTVSGMAKILDFLNTGADRGDMLRLATESEDIYLPKVNWTKLENPARKMEKNTLGKLERDYLFSWYVKNTALQNNDYKGIDDYYTLNTRQNLYQTIKHNKSQNIAIENTTLKHFPELEFYSEDGQLVVFTDKNVIEYQKVYQNKQLVTTIQDTATYKVMMLLEDGYWRVRHFQKMEATAFAKDTVRAKPMYTIKNNVILKNDTPFTIKGINYYPKNSAWDTFGDLFNKDTIARDFDIIKKANLNSVRIFIQ